MRVLIVEDEKAMAAVLAKGLSEEHHDVVVATNGVDGFELARRHAFDVVVLDVMLPAMSGLDVVRRLRRAGSNVPVLLLTARDGIRDIVTGLDCGADDYLTKPFSFEELLARLRTAARHRANDPDGCLRAGDLILDPAAHRVTRGNLEIALSATEFRLLEFFMRRAGRTVPRETIIEAVWGFDAEVEENTLERFIHLLRSKIGDTGDRKLLHTIRGVGYSLREGVE